MSFRNPFKAHAPKKSAISRTAEREFEREVKKLEQLDENAKKLYKDMRRCTESQTAHSKCEAKMTQDLFSSALCKEDDELRKMVESWNQTVQKLELLVQELNASSQKTVVEPMKKFTTIFPSLQAAIKRREASLQEYNKCQAKVDKYQDKERTGANLVKLETNKKYLANAKDDFDNQNSALMEDMPRLYEGRIDYIQPSFQALIKSQVKYYTDCHKAYSDISQRLGNDKVDDNTEEFNKKINQKLAEIRALSITVDD